MALFVANNGQLQTVKGIYYGMAEDYINATLFHNLVPKTSATEIRFLYADNNFDFTDYQRIGYVDNNNFIEVWKKSTMYVLINPRNNYIYAPVHCDRFLSDYKSLRKCIFDNFNTSYVLNMYLMFANCIWLLSLDLSGFNTKNVQNMSYMFYGCVKLSIIISNTFNKSSLKKSLMMFSSCTSLVGSNGTTYSSSHTNAEYARIDGEDGLPGYFTAPTNYKEEKMILREVKSMFVKNYSGLQQIYQKRLLIEGVDYERYMYLEGTGGCYIDTLINPAWNDQLSATTEVSGRPTVTSPRLLAAYGTNTHIGIALGMLWYRYDRTQILAIHKVANENAWTAFVNFPASAEIYMSLKVTNNAVPTISCKINGVTQAKRTASGNNVITELPNTTYKIGEYTMDGLNVLKMKNVKINSHNFIPCQLLKPIPATLDTNNIARAAGECGMIDLISGKFYGNVANSGTFTVENDSNE